MREALPSTHDAIKPWPSVVRLAFVIACLAIGVALVATALPAGQLPQQTTAPAAAAVWRIAGEAVQGGLLFGTAPPGTQALTLDGQPVRLAGDGRFLIGFGRDATSGTLAATLADGSTAARAIVVKPRQWRIESIPSLAQSTVDDPVYDARRAIEVARIAAARAGVSDETGWTQAFAWPAHGRVSGVYGSQRILGGVPKSPHYGVDVAAKAGTPVLAPADGVVRFADGPLLLEGNLVMLDHGHGLVSAFLHLSRLDVHEGDHVRRGDRLGLVGKTGRATGPHLHWAMNWGSVRVDPQLLAVGEP